MNEFMFATGIECSYPTIRNGNALRRRQRFSGETDTSCAANVEWAMAVMFRIFGLIWSNA